MMQFRLSPSSVADADPSGSRLRRRLRRFLVAVSEGLAMLLALVAVEIAFFGRGGFAELGMHPFWLPILIVTIQYGLYAGVITAAAAGFAMDSPTRPLGLDIAAYYVELARQPLQWVGAALVIGLFRHAQIRFEDSKADEIDRLRAMNARFAETVAEQDAQLWRFESEIAVSEQKPPGNGAEGVQLALERLASLRTASAAAIVDRLAAAADALAPNLAPTLLLRGAEGQSVEICGATTAGTPLRGFGFDHPVAHRAERYGVAEGDGAVAVALRRRSGVVVGLLVAPIQAIDADTGHEALRLLADATLEALVAAAVDEDGVYAKLAS